jgi:WD40 repeat protein
VKIRVPAFRIRASVEVAFSPDGGLLAVVGQRVVALWSVLERRRLRSISLLRYPANIAFSPSSAVLAIKSTLGEFVTCEPATGDPIARFIPDDRDEGSGLAFLTDDVIIDGSWTGAIRSRNSSGLKPQTLWHEHHVMVSQLMHSEERGQWAFVIETKHDHPRFNRGADHILLTAAPGSKPFSSLPARWGFLKHAALAPAGDRVAVRFGAKEPVLQVVDTHTGKRLAETPVTHGGTGSALAWSPDAAHVILVEVRGFSFRRAEDLREVGWFPSAYPSAVAFAPSNDLIALGDWQAGLVAEWPAILGQLAPRDAAGR